MDFADFLIGVPSQYNQSQLNPFYARNKYVGLFAQDSWHARPNLTLNYGLRWDRIAPWTEKYNQISTFEAGAQSVLFPGRARGHSLSRRPRSSAHSRPHRQSEFSPRLGAGMVAAGSFRQRCWRRFWGSPGVDQHASQLWQLLHRHRRTLNQRAGRERALWHHIHQPGSAAVRHAVYCRGQRRRTMASHFRIRLHR